MSEKQDPNPYAYGYARMPRIIRKGYKNLTNMQKLLYIYLRDLCGEEGTCYRGLRSLKDETGFSIGYLSVNIPILHNEGLIHAEMKKTRSTHWEVWHITITDIWEKNAQFMREEKDKCSPDEQMIEQSVQGMNRSVHQMNSISESVHDMNESVHAMTQNKNHTNNQLTKNKDREESTLSSPLVDDAPASIIDFEERKAITDKHKAVILKGHTNGHHPDSGTRSLQHHSDGLPGSDGDSREERRRDGVATDRQRAVEEADATEGQLGTQQTSTVPPVLDVQAAIAHAAPTSSLSPNGVQRGAGGKRVHKNVTQAKPPLTLDAQQQAFWDLWCNVWFNAEIKPVLTETAYNHISKLAPYITDAAQLDSLIDYTRKDVAESIGMKRKMVQLGNMVHCYAGWKQAQKPSTNGTFVIDQERNQRNIEAMKARNAQRRLEAHG